jgi:hypothetical protein
MIVKKELPEDQLEAVSSQIATMLAELLYHREPKPSKVELRESFAMFTLDVGNLMADIAEGNLRNLIAHIAKGTVFPVLETNHWHHQILFDGKPSAHARSEIPPGKPPRVVEVAISPLASKIDAAIEGLENAEDQWPEFELVHVQFLAFEPLLIHTFRLLELKKLYIIDAFAELVKLQDGHLIEESDFLTILNAGVQFMEERLRKMGHLPLL